MHEVRKKYIQKELSKEIKETEKILERTKRKLNPDYTGASLTITSNRGYTQYYVKLKNGSKQFVPKSMLPYVREIAQQSYNEDIVRLAEAQLKYLEAIQNRIDKLIDLHQVYDKFKDNRKELVKPYQPAYEEYGKKWLIKNSVNLTFREESLVYRTNNNEFVRSKSEMFIANTLKQMGLFYIYEKPLQLHSGLTIFPDFTILDPVSLDVVYLEHFGMMSNPEYAKDAITKINRYITEGFELGNSFLTTFEGADSPLNTRAVEIMLKTRFKK